MFRSSSMCKPVRTGMTLNNKEIQNQKENFRRTRSQETKEDGKMKIIGITGGVGCGKSKVLSWFQALPDTKVYEADQIAHLLQEPGACCYKEIVAELHTILKEDRKIDRKILGSVRAFGCNKAGKIESDRSSESETICEKMYPGRKKLPEQDCLCWRLHCFWKMDTKKSVMRSGIFTRVRK